LVSGQRMAVDASLIEADANKQNSTPKEEWDVAQIDPADASRAVREYLETLDEAAFGAANGCSPSSCRIPTPPASGRQPARTRHSSAIPTII
jgi:hypothetical protein